MIPLNTSEKLPAVWDEKGKGFPFYDIALGYLLGLLLYNPPSGNTRQTKFFGICRGCEETECGPRLLMEVPGNEFSLNTAGKMCKSERQKFYFDNICLIKILARDYHAVYEIFHGWGTTEVSLKFAREQIKNAQSELSRLPATTGL